MHYVSADHDDPARAFELHGKPLCRAVELLTGSREAAESIVGDVFRCWSADGPARARARLSLEGWLYRSAVLRVREWQATHVDGVRTPADPSRPGERLLATFARLPRAEREILVMNEKGPDDDLAGLLDLTPEEAEARLERALALFRELYRGSER